MRKTIIAVVAALSLSGCITIGQAITAADYGRQIYKAVKSAKNEHPDDLQKRIEIYAELYCGFRDTHALEWEKVYEAAKSKGASEGVLNTLKSHIDKTCGVGDA